VIPLQHLRLLEQPVNAFAEREGRPPGGDDRWQRLVRTPVGQVIAPVGVHGHVDGPRWQSDRLDRGEVIHVAHVRHDEAALAAALDQGREPGRGSTVRVHYQEPTIGGGPARLLAKLPSGETADLVSTELDQPLGLLSRGGQGWQRGRHAGTSGRVRLRTGPCTTQRHATWFHCCALMFGSGFGGSVAAGVVATALAFGLVLLALAYAIGPLIVGGTALCQLWLCIVAPPAGGAVAAGLRHLVFTRGRPGPGGPD
jgi:hypothetical protein